MVICVSLTSFREGKGETNLNTTRCAILGDFILFPKLVRTWCIRKKKRKKKIMRENPDYYDGHKGAVKEE